MSEKSKEGNTKNIICKAQLNARESQILDEICGHCGLTKSGAIRRALQYYHDDLCSYQTERKDVLGKAAKDGYLNGYEFSILIQDFAISEHGYVIDTGNWQNVNAEVALCLAEKIRKHPLLWRLFFMVA